MRKALCLALGKYAGQVLTREVALDLLTELFPDKSINPSQFAPETVGPFTLQCERFTRCDEFHALHAAYHAETDHTGAALDVDYDRLADMAHAGQLAQFTARTNGELVGLMRVFVGCCTNTKHLTVSDNLFFITPAHRSLLLATRLWRYAERSMFSIGAREVSFVGLGRAARMARFLGYPAVGTKFSKTHQGNDYGALTTRHTEVPHDPKF